MASLALLAALAPQALAYDVVQTDPEGELDELNLHVGGYIEPRFHVREQDESANTVGELGYEIRHARIETDIRLFEHDDEGERTLGVRGRVTIELMPDARLEDAWVNLRQSEVLQLRLGQMQSPVSRTRMMSDRRILFPERPELIEVIPRREQGAMVHGNLGDNVVEYYVGAFNGEGPNRISNVNRKLLYAGRFVLSPIGGPGTFGELLDHDAPATFSLGYAVNFNVEGEPGEEEARIGHNVEAFAHWKHLTAQGEVHYGLADWENTDLADYHFSSWYGQGAMFVPGSAWTTEHLALVFRQGYVEEFDSDVQVVPLTGPEDAAQARTQTSFGLGLYAGRELFPTVHDLRVLVTYTLNNELEGSEYDNNELTVGGHFGF